MSRDVYRHDAAGLIVTVLSAGTGRGSAYQITVGDEYVVLDEMTFLRFAKALGEEHDELAVALWQREARRAPG